MVKVGEGTAKALRAMGAKQNKLLGKLVGTARVAGTRSSVATKGSVLDKLLTSNARDERAEKTRRRKNQNLGIKSAVSTLAGYLTLK